MRCSRFSLGLASPLRTAHGETTTREGFLAVVTPGEDDVAVRGVGEATPLPGWTESLSACESGLASPDAVAELSRDSVTDPCGSHTSGALPDLPDLLDPHPTPAARHAVTVAQADARARDADRSLATRLAAGFDLPTPADSVPVNATVGDGTPEKAAREASRAADAGYPAVKLKVAARGLDADLERLEAVRNAVGPAVDVRADANGGWDRATARRALDRMAGLDVAYVEQPLPASDLRGIARLRRESDVPVAVDESVAERGVEAVLAADAADVLVLKPMALGGLDRALAAALSAREAGVEPVVTTTVDAVVARTAAVHLAAAIPDVRPCGLATGSLLAADLATPPYELSNGAIRRPTAPGLAGDAFDELGERHSG